MYCQNCGAQIDDKAEICPKCGVRSKSDKSAGIAVIASFIFPGLGQFYNGEIGKGILFIIISIISAILMMFGIGAITFLLVWIYSMYDAYKVAESL